MLETILMRFGLSPRAISQIQYVAAERDRNFFTMF